MYKIQATSARHPANNHIFEKVLRLKAHAQKKFRMNMIKAYNKALKSLGDYPLPILSSTQCKCLQGFGDKMASMVEKLNSDKYK